MARKDFKDRLKGIFPSSDKTEKSKKTSKVTKTEDTGKTKKGKKSKKINKTEKSKKSKKSDKSKKPDKIKKSEESDKTVKTEKLQKTEKTPKVSKDEGVLEKLDKLDKAIRVDQQVYNETDDSLDNQDTQDLVDKKERQDSEAEIDEPEGLVREESPSPSLPSPKKRKKRGKTKGASQVLEESVEEDGIKLVKTVKTVETNWEALIAQLRKNVQIAEVLEAEGVEDLSDIGPKLHTWEKKNTRFDPRILELLERLVYWSGEPIENLINEAVLTLLKEADPHYLQPIPSQKDKKKKNWRKE